MALYIPTQQSRYLLQGLFSEQKFQALVASGALDIGTLAPHIKQGDFVNVPQIVQVPDFARVDITSTTPVTGTNVASNDAKAVVLRDYSMINYSRHDELRTGEDFVRLTAQSAGNKLAKRIIKTAELSMKGFFATALTTHTKSTTAAITVQNVRATKAKLGDQGAILNTMLIHSSVWFDLVYDLVANYKYMGVTSGTIIQDGGLETIMGVRNIIVSDDLVAAAGATSSAGDDLYSTWLLGEGALYFSYQQEPLVEEWKNVTIPSTLNYVKYSMDYAISPRGAKWNTTGNPLDSDLSTGASWATAYEDHRNVRIAELKSYGGVNA